jgi:hypothetical protein
MDEALVAEDRAIRFADLTRGHRSGHFAGNEVYRQTREQCMGDLFQAVAVHHGVSIEDVRRALGYRRLSVDLVILASFGTFYVFVCGVIARWIFRAVPVDRMFVRAFATIIGAGTAATAALFSFGLYSSLIEMLRIGNTHMSYRVGRSPWAGHRIHLLIGAVMLFAMVAAYRHLCDWRQERGSQRAEHAG